jgi:hypothetical protein
MTMKRIFAFLIAVMTCFVVTAQTPQAVCYQGVATDQQGRELVSQSIKVRLSILKTSAAGTEEWVETHSVTTDGFGLFDLPIGVGTRTGGAQTVFSNIKWGADKYFLRVEMDIAGGSNYVVMGVNQLISVPYALYSDKTGVADSAVAASRSVTSITSNTSIYANRAGRSDTAQFAWLADSARRAQFAWLSDSSRRAGISQFSFISDSSRRAGTAYYSFNSANTVYATRAGRSDTAQYAWLADSARRANYAVNAGNSLTSGRALTAGRSDTAQFAWLADSARRANYAVNAGNSLTSGRALTAGRSDTAQFAWLADSARRANYAVNAGNSLTSGRALTAGRSDTAQYAWLADSARRANYAVNAGAAQTAINAQNAQNAVNSQNAINAQNAQQAVNATNAQNAQNAVYATNAGRSVTSGRADTAQYAWVADSSRRSFQASQALTALDDRDRDSTNEIQSMTYDTTSRTLKLSKLNGQFDVVNFNGTPLGAAGASIDYPYGILGEAVLITANYIVPTGKTLFISAANNPITMSDGKRLNIEPGMPILPSGSNIASCFCSGILVETKAYAVPVILDFATPNFEYEIPMGKSFVIKSGTNDSRDMSFLIDGTNYSFYTGSSASPRLVVIPEGKKMRRGLTNVGLSFTVTGYLLNKAP